MPEQKEVPNCFIFTFMGFMILTGSINTIANKLQQCTVSLGMKFEHHQKFITFCMFLGESVCFLIYLIKSRTQKGKNEIPSKNQPLMKEDDEGRKTNSASGNESEKKKKTSIFVFALPALCDLCASTSMSISLTFLAPSIYQMFRGAIIIFTSIFSVIFLKSKIHRHHVLGISIVVCGLIVVGLKAVLFSKSGPGQNPVLGIVLVVVAQIFSSTMFIVEEKLLKHLNEPALKVVGLEGIWGSLFYFILLFLFYYIRCDSWPSNLKTICQPDPITEARPYRFENAIFALQQIANSYRLMIIGTLYISSIALFNFSGLSVTKYVSSTARSIVDTLRTIIIWCFFVINWLGDETTEDTFHYLQLIGFILLIIGSIIYNEIVEIPFLGFNKNTKRALKARLAEKEGKEQGKDDDDPETVEQIKEEIDFAPSSLPNDEERE